MPVKGQERHLSIMATNQTPVNISISPDLDAFLQSPVKSGRNQTTSEFVRGTLRLLERHEMDREEGPVIRSKRSSKGESDKPSAAS